jgi:hypothetical protein
VTKKKAAKATKPTTEDHLTGIDAVMEDAANRAADFIIAELESRFIGRVESLEKRLAALEAQASVHTQELIRLATHPARPWWRLW